MPVGDSETGFVDAEPNPGNVRATKSRKVR